MSKRFPVPEFNRDEFKNLDWAPPKVLSAGERDKLVSSARAGEARPGAQAVTADEALYAKHGFRGDHRLAIMCILPKGREVTVLGRSYAWSLQRALLLDSLDPITGKVIADWRTPRTMNTRLGPENGITLQAGVVFALLGNRYADHWIANRVAIDNQVGIVPGEPGFRILSAYDDQSNDFHACNLAFSWKA